MGSNLTCNTDPERSENRLRRELVDETSEETQDGDDSCLVVRVICEHPSESVEHLRGVKEEYQPW